MIFESFCFNLSVVVVFNFMAKFKKFCFQMLEKCELFSFGENISLIMKISCIFLVSLFQKIRVILLIFVRK